jgi:ribosome-associated translation inhibitor RaiA
MSELEVQVVTVHGSADPRAQAYARRKIGQLVRLAPGPVLAARVKLDRASDPAVERPATAKASLDLNGRQVRAQASARQVNEAVDLLEARLRARLEHLAGRLRARRRRTAAAKRTTGR